MHVCVHACMYVHAIVCVHTCVCVCVCVRDHAYTCHIYVICESMHEYGEFICDCFV